MNTDTKQPTISAVKSTCKALGVRCSYNSHTKEFCVGGYYTDDRHDAIATAKHMAIIIDKVKQTLDSL